MTHNGNGCFTNSQKIRYQPHSKRLSHEKSEVVTHGFSVGYIYSYKGSCTLPFTVGTYENQPSL